MRLWDFLTGRRPPELDASARSELAALSWPEDWFSIDDPSAARRLEAELRRELPRGHVLRGVAARAVGRGADPDDVLFALAAGPDIRVATAGPEVEGSPGEDREAVARWAEVHLTWHKESEAPWPWTVLHADLGSWLESIH